MSDTTNRAEDQARAQLASIKEMVARYDHARTCPNRGNCERATADNDGLTLMEYHDEEAAREAIEYDPLSLRMRSDWALGPEDFKPYQYELLLSTGGPATRIIGVLNESGDPERASLEYQDWGTQWTRIDLTDEDIEALLEYSRCFNFD